jgi:hypothetical protein
VPSLALGIMTVYRSIFLRPAFIACDSAAIGVTTVCPATCDVGAWVSNTNGTCLVRLVCSSIFTDVRSTTHILTCCAWQMVQRYSAQHCIWLNDRYIISRHAFDYVAIGGTTVCPAKCDVGAWVRSTKGPFLVRLVCPFIFTAS